MPRNGFVRITFFVATAIFAPLVPLIYDAFRIRTLITTLIPAYKRMRLDPQWHHRMTVRILVCDLCAYSASVAALLAWMLIIYFR